MGYLLRAPPPLNGRPFRGSPALKWVTFSGLPPPLNGWPVLGSPTKMACSHGFPEHAVFLQVCGKYGFPTVVSGNWGFPLLVWRIQLFHGFPLENTQISLENTGFPRLFREIGFPTSCLEDTAFPRFSSGNIQISIVFGNPSFPTGFL